MMVFPANRVHGKMTINGRRGCHHLIRDRFDLTVECIRRHYQNEPSPLSDVLMRYADFFKLFIDFHSYVEFFLLQDLVAEDFSAVKYFTPFDNFSGSPLPANKKVYVEYMQHAITFITARAQRILEAQRS